MNAIQTSTRSAADPTVLVEVRKRLLADPAHSDAAVSATSMSLFLVQHPEVRVSTLADYPEFAARFTATEAGGDRRG
ncbi:hypothetical protein [Streptomyces sp. S186]|uniref:hypothetical protein n=1 Tax=Streptomyces sp. S186 TaxID=3434395 RepID=UPI003F67657C